MKERSSESAAGPAASSPEEAAHELLTVLVANANLVKSNPAHVARMAATEEGRKQLQETVRYCRSHGSAFQTAAKELTKAADVLSLALRKKRFGLRA